MTTTTRRSREDAALRAAIAELIAPSATFEERAAGELVVSEPSPRDEMIAICRAVGISPEAVAVRGPVDASLARARVRDASTLPAWATALELLLADPTPASPDDEVPGAGAEDDGAFAPAFSGFVAAAGAWLDQAIDEAPTSVDPAARRGLLAWLCRSLMRQARFVLFHELHASACGSPRDYARSHLASRDGWLALLGTYPVLARLLGTHVAVWQRVCAQLLSRLASDWEALGETGAPVLSDVSALTLDRPPGGGPPLRITLPGGARFVYQCKDLRMAAWFGEVVSALAREGLTPSLEPHWILAREDYAWAAFVEASPCTDATEVERYFTRAGMYLRLFQALRVTDMHGRNVVAAGEHPVFIDMETVLQPARGTRGSSPAELAVGERYDRSPLAVSLLPVWLLGEPGRAATNVGGLNRGGRLTFPVRETSHADPTTPEARRGGDYPTKRITPTLPAVGEDIASMGEHLPHILAGYRSMSAALARSERVRELVARAADQRVKVLWRSGFLHTRVAKQSLTPMLLTDGRLRDAFLTRLMLGLPDDRARTLARHELWALRDGGTPVFRSRPTSDGVLVPGGGEVPGVFAASAFDRLEVVRAPVDEDRDLDAIASAIGVEAEAHGDAPPALEAPAKTAPVGPPRATPLDQAVAIADFIAGEAVTAGGETLWVGASWCPTAGVRRLGALPADLLSGNAGLAVLFAYLHRRCGAPRFRDAATRALAPVSRNVRATMGLWPRWAKNPRSCPRGLFSCGAYVGVGAQLYALRKCAALLDDAPLAELARRCLASVPPELVAACSPRDVLMGAAGLVLVAANVFETSPPRPANLEPIATMLRGEAAPRRALYVDGAGCPAWLPGEREGVAWALARWDAPSGPAAAPGVIEPAPAGEPRASLEDLVATLAARDASGDDALTDRAHRITDAIVSRRRDTGRWLADPYVADRYHLSTVTGLGALALSMARVDAPELRCCARLVY